MILQKSSFFKELVIRERQDSLRVSEFTIQTNLAKKLMLCQLAAAIGLEEATVFQHF